MHTYRGGTNWTAATFPESESADITTWQYDIATGLVTNKIDARTNAVSYTYTAEGRLAGRTWARDESTAYSYDPDTGQMTNVNYSGSTPDVAYTYDRLGRRKIVTDAQGTRTFVYNANLQLESETIDWGDNRCIDAVMGDLKKLLGINVDPEFSHIKRHPKALPLYQGAYLNRWQEINRHLSHLPGLHIEGNFCGGVSIRDRISRGQILADRIAAQMGPAENSVFATLKPLVYS